MRSIRNLVLVLALILASASSGQAWNAYNDYALNTMPSPWSYVFQAGSAFNGAYDFANMVPYSGELYIPSGWKAPNTAHYFMPQCGVWQGYGYIATNSCQVGGGLSVGQGFVRFTAPSSGTYRVNGTAWLYTGVSNAKCRSWIRSDHSGMQWNQILNEQNTGAFDFTLDLSSGQTICFGQDILTGTGSYASSPLYWTIDCNLLSGHSVSGLERWDAYKDFCNTAQGHRNWRYIYSSSNPWAGGFVGTDMSASASYQDWWMSGGSSYINGQMQCGAKADNSTSRVVLTGYHANTSNKALPMLLWNAPRNGYYRIHGDVELMSSVLPGNVQLCVSVRDSSTAAIMNVSIGDTNNRSFDGTVLLDKGDGVMFGIGSLTNVSQTSSSWNVQIEQVASVPSPWTPLASSGNAVSCWGRTYDFASALMPNSIMANGTGVLSSGVRIDAVIGSTTEGFSNTAYSLDAINSEYAEMTTAGYSPSLKATCKWRLEYDGMLLCSLTVEPRTGTVNLARLDLVLPFSQSVAKLFHSFPYATLCTSPLNSGAIAPINFVTRATNPNGSMTFPDFLNGLWIGDEKRGLQWFAESGQGLNSSTPFATLDSSKSLKLNLLASKTISPSSPFKFTFGFQASPVKPALPVDQPRYGMWPGYTNCWNHDSSGQLCTPSASWLHYLDSIGMDSMHPWGSAEGADTYAGDPYNVSTNGIDYQMDDLCCCKGNMSP